MPAGQDLRGFQLILSLQVVMRTSLILCDGSLSMNRQSLLYWEHTDLHLHGSGKQKIGKVQVHFYSILDKKKKKNSIATI